MSELRNAYHKRLAKGLKRLSEIPTQELLQLVDDFKGDASQYAFLEKLILMGEPKEKISIPEHLYDRLMAVQAIVSKACNQEEASCAYEELEAIISHFTTDEAEEKDEQEVTDKNYRCEDCVFYKGGVCWFDISKGVPVELEAVCFNFKRGKK